MNTIEVALYGGSKLTLEVAERTCYEPSMGQWDEGYTCVDPEFTDPDDLEHYYFVSDDGTVWRYPGDFIVGIAEDIQAAFDAREEEYESMMEFDHTPQEVKEDWRNE